MFLIIGWGRTGKEAYNYCVQNHWETFIYDDKWSSYEMVDIKGTDNVNEIPWNKISKTILSPGVPTWHQLPPVITQCRQKGIPIFSDLDILYHNNYSSKFIGITGSQGKTTIHDFLTKFLQNHYAVSSGGNNGVPALCLPSNPNFCLEVSMQLLWISQSILFDIGIINNFFDTHQEFGDYNFRLNTKRKILQRTTNGNQKFIIGDFPHGIIKQLGSWVGKDDIGVFSSNYHTLGDVGTNNYVFVGHENQDHQVIWYYQGNQGKFILAKGLGLKLLAIENIGIVWAFFLIMGHHNEEHFKSLLHGYNLIDHRLTLVKHAHNIYGFNGSKCTNTFAFKSLLDYIFYFHKRKNYWILGGILNSPVEYFYDHRIRHDNFYILGQDGRIIYDYLITKGFHCQLFNNLSEVMAAINKDKNIETVPLNIMLTPGCQSFDQFKDFEHRGNEFSILLNTMI